MIEKLNFNFAKHEDQEKFQELSEEEREKIKNEALEEATVINKKIQELPKKNIIGATNTQKYNLAEKIVEQKKNNNNLEVEQKISDPNEHLIKITLADEERKLSLKELQKKYGISKNQAYRARKMGSFCINAQIPKEGSRVVKTTNRKHRPLTKEERILGVSSLAKKLNVSESSASRIKQRGYIIEEGRRTNFLPDGEMPKGITEKEIINDCGTAYARLIKRYPPAEAHRKDLIGEGAMRLLELTAEDKFIIPHWRQKIAYYAMFNYAIKNIFQPYKKEMPLPDHDKDEILSDYDEEFV